MTKPANIHGTDEGNLTIVLPRTVRELIKLRKKYGHDSAIGHRASNIIEMLKQPQINAKGIQYQRDGIAAALAELTDQRDGID